MQMNPFITELVCSQTGHLLARVINLSSINLSATQFFTSGEEILQCGIISYKADNVPKFHYHHPLERVTEGTHEILYVLEGQGTLQVFSRSTNLVQSQEIRSGDLINLISGAHRIISDKGVPIVMIEVKNGPYQDQTADKVFLEQ
jgi:mannose-6-phosphate isomerase-like protein (cupin superfamily)